MSLCLTGTHIIEIKCLFPKSEPHIVALLITGEFLYEVVVELFRIEYYLKSKASLVQSRVQCTVSLLLLQMPSSLSI